MKTTTLLFVLAVMFFAACTVTQEYHFNNDLSGRYLIEMEMGEMITMIKAMDTTGNMSSLDTLDKSFKDIAVKYKEAGAKNVDAGWRENKTTVFISFDFESIESLNSIMKSTSENSDMLSFSSSKNPAKFSHKGTRNISIDLPEPGNDTTSMANIEQMKEYLTIETIFSFDRKISKVSNPNAVLSEDNKSFKFENKIDEMMKDGFSLDSDVKLKRK